MIDKELQRSFLEFREQCIWLCCCYNTYKALYESDRKVRDALYATAKIFFNDLNKILIEYIILQVCKITDPAKSIGRDNLTVKYIDKTLHDSGLMTEEIKDYSLSLHRYRKIIIDARNRLISHSDKESVETGNVIGAHEAEEVEAFFKNLQEYADAVGIVVELGPLDFSSTSGPGDVSDLIKKLCKQNRGHNQG